MRKNNSIKIGLAFLFCCFSLVSCYEDYTHYYEDLQAPGLSIFSDRANNLMTCYVDGHPWRTYDRINGYREVNIQRQITSGATDFLVINWEGEFSEGNFNFSDNIKFMLSIPKSFTYKEFNDLQGKRLIVDTTNSFFIYGSRIGPGNIYFHFANLDSVDLNSYHGRISGLFDADFGAIKIGNGRFDHEIDSSQVNF